jgi:MFS family permease
VDGPDPGGAISGGATVTARAGRAEAGAARGSGWRLGFAAAGVMLAAADTYVVVLALPAIMSDIGLSLDHLEAATPIISGFLLGYVALLPLLGRLSDIVGRGRVFTGCLLVFAFGSLITSSAQDLTGAVVGRALQGAGGGGLVPVTLAIVADLWPAGRRGIPLGVVGGVQELGAVLGPLYGAAILSFSTWRLIFWLNLPLAALLGAGFLRSRPAGGERAGEPGRPAGGAAGEGAAEPAAREVEPGGRSRPQRRGERARAVDLPGSLLLASTLGLAGLAVAAPGPLAGSAFWGVLWGPVAGDSAWTTPLALAALVGAALSIVRGLTGDAGAPRLLRLRRLPELWGRVDGLGGALLAVALGFVVISFAAADPSRGLVAPAAVVLLPAALVVAAAFAVRELRAPAPLLPLGELRDPAAVGALLANLAIGAGLMAALVDVPIFARATAYGSQLGAALVLLRLLAAVPVGAVLGGFLCERLGYRVTTLLGMGLTTAMFVLMGGWTASSLGAGLRLSDPVLAGCGLGFGLAIAPVNAAILGAVTAARHGLAAALVVVARMVGMLVGISLLTAIGLHRYYQEAATIPSPAILCPGHPLSCAAYNALAEQALLDELRTIFLAAAVCTGAAGAIGVAMLRRRGGRDPGAMAAALGA